jgi:hypothetical protein
LIKSEKKEGGILIKDCEKSQDQLATFVTQCFLSLKTYGKGADSLEASINLHLMCLEDYPFAKVKGAFMQHIRASNEAPTPADIIKIIESQPPTEYDIIQSIIWLNEKLPHLVTKQQKDKLQKWQEMQK